MIAIAFERRAAPSRAWALASPLLALAMTVAVGMLLFAALGKPATQAVQMFFIAPLQTWRGVGEVLLKATPLALCGVGLALCFRANVWNIGAEGQLVIGAACGGGAALALGAQAPAASWVLVLIAGAAGGAAWAAITALLRDRFHANEILVSLMLVYVAQLLLSWLVQGPWRDPAGFGFPQSAMFAAEARVPRLVDGMRVNIGALLALTVALMAAGLLWRTRAGFQLTVSGLSPRAARYAGFSQRRVLWTSLTGCGALAGVAGALEAAGPVGQLLPTISPGYGFAAIIVAFVARLSPLGVLPAAVLLALFFIGGELAQSRLGLPSALTGVYQGLMLFFLLATDTLVDHRLRLRRVLPS